MSGSLPPGFELAPDPPPAAMPAAPPPVFLGAPDPTPTRNPTGTDGPLIEFPSGGGKLPDGTVTNDPAVWARWKQQWATPVGTGPAAAAGPGPADAHPVPPATTMPAAAHDLPPGFELVGDEPPAAPPKRSGMLANAGAALAEGAGGILNTLSDPIGNLVTKPLSTAIIAGHDLLAPVFGYQPFPDSVRNTLYDENVPQLGSAAVNKLGAVIGANPEDVAPATEGEALVRKGVGAALGGVALGGGGAMRTAAINPALAAGGAVAGHEAATMAPERYQPAVELLGNTLLPLAAEGSVAVGRAAGRKVGEIAEPFIGRKTDIVGPNGTPILDERGQPVRMLEDGAPLQATAGQRARVGRELAAMVDDPTAARAALANVPPSPIPGEKLTSAQAFPDPKLASAEKQIAPTPIAAAGFRARQDSQNDARVAHVQRVGAGADPRAINAKVGRDAAQQDATMQREVDRVRSYEELRLDIERQFREAETAAARQRAEQAAANIGGRRPGDEAAAGRDLSAPVLAAEDAARERRSQMYNAVDPENKLALDVSAIRNRAKEELAARTEFDDPMSAKEAAIWDVASRMKDVHLFRDVRTLRSRITNLMKGARRDPERAAEYGRMSQLLKSVEATLDGQLDKADLAPDAPAPAAPSRPAAEAPAGRAAIPDEIHRGDGTRIPVKYKVVEARDLVTSHNDNLSENGAYPQDMQPKDRGTAASADQINTIHRKNQPHLLSHSTSLNEGAPLVDAQGQVVNGNGRVLGLRRVYDDGGPAAQAYRDHIASLGHDVDGFREPVLVRELPGDTDHSTKVSLAQEGGGSTGLKASAPEQARVDATRIDADLMDRLKPGPLDGPENGDFVREFARQVLDKNSLNNFTTSKGVLSQSGAKRVRDALVHLAYGDDGVTAAHAEVTEPHAKVFLGAMADAAGPMARLKAGIKARTVDPSMDLAPAIVEAANAVAEARKKNLPLAEYLAQRDMFDRISPEAEAQLKVAYGDALEGRMSQEAMADYLAEYAARAEKIGMTQSMFGDNVTSAEIVRELSSRYGKDSRTATKTQPAPAKGDGGGAGGNGDQARGPIAGAGRQEAPSGGSGEPASRQVIPEKPPLEANYDPAAVDRYRAANAQNRADRARFNEAPGVKDITKRGKFAGEPGTPPEKLPAIIVRAGPQGAEAAKAYLAAGGTTQHLADAAALSLRDAAERNGVIDETKFLSWASRRQSFLSQIPEARRLFGAAAEATALAKMTEKQHAAALQEASAAAKKAIQAAEQRMAAAQKDRQDSAIGRFLGDREPVAEVGAILRDKSRGPARMRALLDAIGSDADAKAGLERAVAQHIMDSLQGTEKGPTSIEGKLKGAAYRDLLKLADPQLKMALSPESYAALQQVGTSIDKTSRTATVGTGSDTAQKAGGLLDRVMEHLPSSGSGGGVGGALGFALAGPAGAAVGGTLGAAVAAMIRSAHQAGIRNVADLKANALLHPELMAALITEVTPQNRVSVARRLTEQLRRISLIQATTSKADQRADMPTPPRNSLH